MNKGTLVVTRNNVDAAISWFTRNGFEYELVYTSVNELMWNLPVEALDKVRDWFAHDDFVLWFK